MTPFAYISDNPAAKHFKLLKQTSQSQCRVLRKRHRGDEGKGGLKAREKSTGDDRTE